MIESAVGIGVDVVAGTIAWLLTYAVHSTLLLGMAALSSAWLVRGDAWRETIWKAALIGGLVTASAQAIVGYQPLVGPWTLSGATNQARVDSPVQPVSTEPRVAEPAALIEEARSLANPDIEGSARVEAAPARAETSDAAAEAAPTTYAADADPLGIPWTGIALGAWLTIATILVGGVARHQWRLHWLLRSRREVTDNSLRAMLAEMRRHAGIWRQVRLTESDACPTPLALGSSEICVPTRFLTGLDREQQRSALAHELAHLARRDPAWHLAAGIVEAVFFFQPLNRLARLRLRSSAENLCDDWAVRQTGSAIGLARCLAEVASWVGHGDDPVPQGTMAMAEGGSPLLRRVERLLAHHEPHSAGGQRLRPTLAMGLLVVVAIVAPSVSLLPGDSPRLMRDRGAVVGLGDRVADGGELQQEVIRHPDPSQPLDSRWEWAFNEAGRRNARSYWVAYGFERMLRPGEIIVEDSGGWSTTEFEDPPLGSIVFGPSYRAPREDGDSAVPQPMLVLFRFEDGGDASPRVVRIGARTASVGMPLDGDALYWLGMASEPESFEWLSPRIDDLPNTTLRTTVVGLIALHPSSERVVPFLAGVVHSNRPKDLRVEAAEGLEWHATPESVALLRETALGDASAEVAAEAAEALGEIRMPEASAALAGIVRSDAQPDVRAEAVEAMSGQPDPQHLETLFQVAMEDPDPGIQDEAIETISEFPAAESAPILERIVRTHPDPGMREEAVEKLGDADPAAATRILEELLRSDTSSDVRREVLDALAEQPSPRVLEAVVATAMSDPDPDLQRDAVEMLAELDPAGAAPHLGRIVFEHPEPSVRRQAAESLGELPVEVALPILDDILERHPDEEVVQQAVESIGELPSELSEPRLLEIARSHPAERVRQEAFDQLGHRIPPR